MNRERSRRLLVGAGVLALGPALAVVLAYIGGAELLIAAGLVLVLIAATLGMYSRRGRH